MNCLGAVHFRLSKKPALQSAGWFFWKKIYTILFKSCFSHTSEKPDLCTLRPSSQHHCRTIVLCASLLARLKTFSFVWSVCRLFDTQKNLVIFLTVLLFFIKYFASRQTLLSISLFINSFSFYVKRYESFWQNMSFFIFTTKKNSKKILLFNFFWNY